MNNIWIQYPDVVSDTAFRRCIKYKNEHSLGVFTSVSFEFVDYREPANMYIILIKIKYFNLQII